ncbi:M50 family metallopeptidase [candidate division KSB1 bacterium]
MKRMLFLIFFIPFSISFLLNFKSNFPSIFVELSNFYLFGAGILFFFLVRLIPFSNRKGNFFENFSHELTHYLFALLFFKRVTSFKAYSKYGGEINLYGGNFLIALSPYFFPTFTVFFLILKPILINEVRQFIDIFIGFTYTFHLSLFIKDFSVSQPDIKITGRAFSLIFVTLANVLLIAGISIIIGRDYSFFFEFLKLSVNSIIDFFVKIAGVLNI